MGCSVVFMYSQIWVLLLLKYIKCLKILPLPDGKWVTDLAFKNGTAHTSELIF